MEKMVEKLQVALMTFKKDYKNLFLAGTFL